MADDSSKQNDTANKTIYTDPDELKKVEAQILVYDGEKWLEISNTRTTNVLNVKIDSVADQVKEAQQGIATATANAQTAVASANDAIAKSNLLETNVNSLSTEYDGLQTLVNNKADSSVFTQLSDVVDTKVSKTELDNLNVVGANLLANTSASYAIVTNATDWNTNLYYDDVEISVSSATTYTLRAYLKPTTHSVHVQLNYEDSSGTWSYNNGNDIDAGNEGYSTVTVTVPAGATIKGATVAFVTQQSDSTQIEYKEFKLEIGSKATPWTVSAAEIATQSEITQLSDDINLRVTKGDVVSQINQEAGGNTLIQVANGKGKLYLDASSVVFGGTAYITDAMIANVTADKITAGTMNVENIAMKGSLATLDISGDNLTFKSNDTDGWSTTINQDGINFTGSYNSVQEFMGGLYLGYEQQDTRVNGFYTTIVTNQRMKNKISTAGGDETGINVPYLVNGNVTDDYKIIYNASGVGHSMGLHIYDDTYISHQDPLISGLSSEDSHIYADTVQTLHLAAQGNVALEPNTGFTMFSGTGYIHSDSYRNLIGTTGAQYTVFQNAKVSSTDTNHLGSVHLWELQYGALTNTSRLSLKKNIELVNIDDMADKIYGIDVAAFNYKTQLDTAKKSIGPIVDDVNETKKYRLPSDFIAESGNGTDDHSLIGALIATVQKQAKQISELELRMVSQELKG
ncbi:tail fiber domain-containing protein [Liquorilactobacillus nagelii]|uniref:tail fiber domain-containing protein n=3 Tax=Lactobacillales TaxID=186826 RepID=UPI0039ECCCC9